MGNPLEILELLPWAGRCSNPFPSLFQPSGRGVRLPEVFCIISCLGCFGLFSKVGMWWLWPTGGLGDCSFVCWGFLAHIFLSQILDEVEKRRQISMAVIYPFMQGLRESPFPAPGKTVTIKSFIPESGTEVGGGLGGTSWIAASSSPAAPRGAHHSRAGWVMLPGASSLGNTSVISLLIQEKSSEDEDRAHPQGMMPHLCIPCSSPSLKLELPHKNFSAQCWDVPSPDARAGCCASGWESGIVPGAGSCLGS